MQTCSFFRLCSDDCVQVRVTTASRRTQAEQTQDAGTLEAGRGRSGGGTRAVWTRVDPQLSYFLVVLYDIACQLYQAEYINCMDSNFHPLY